MTLIRESWKAVMATVLTAAITFLTSTGGPGGLSNTEGLRSAGLSLLAGLLVWLTPNEDKEKNDIEENDTSVVHPSVVRDN